MKYLIILSLIFLSSFKASQFDVRCTGIEGNGMVQLIVTNSQLGPKYKVELAKKDALYTVLYTGVSGCGKVNPLLNSAESIEKFKKIERSYFSKNGKWSKYTRQSTANTNSGPIGQHVIAVDLPVLRKDLENLNIIKSLTNGF